MKRPLIGVILFAIGLPVGWVLAAIGAGASAAGADVRHPADQSPRARAAAGERTFARPIAVAEFGVPIGELEGLHAFHGASPVPTFKNWQTGLDTLAQWLDLTPAEKQALEEILEEAARRLIEWEEQHITANLVDGRNFLLEWKVSPALRRDLRAAIDDAFAPELARSIWLKGDLANFGRLPAALVSGDGATILLIPGQPGVPTVRVRRAHARPDSSLQLPRSRFDHLIDWDQHFSAHGHTAELAQFPEAKAVPGRPGFVFSPGSGKLVDVRGIPHGTLVGDPGSEENKYFHVPAAEDE